MPRVIDRTPRIGAREYFTLQKTAADHIFWYREAVGCRIMIDWHNRPPEGSLDLWPEPGKSGQDSVERCDQNLISRGSEARRAHIVGPVLEEFLWEVSPYNVPERNGRIVHQATTKEPDHRWVCCRIFDSASFHIYDGRRGESGQ